jgi:hypothetical protein
LSLQLDSIRAISRAVAERQGLRLEDVQIVSGIGGTDRVEVLITIAGCHRDPCSLLLNLTRIDRPQFEEELAAKLRDALGSHVRSPGTG